MVPVSPMRRCYKIWGMIMHSYRQKICYIVRNSRTSIGNLSCLMKIPMSECLYLCTPSLPFPLRLKYVLVVLSLFVFISSCVLNSCSFVLWLHSVVSIYNMMLFLFIPLLCVDIESLNAFIHMLCVAYGPGISCMACIQHAYVYSLYFSMFSKGGRCFCFLYLLYSKVSKNKGGII